MICFKQNMDDDDGEDQPKRVNPILEAKRRKEMMNSSPSWTTPESSNDLLGRSGNRNPFKKAATPKESPRLVFSLI
jgi:hypothetical protein